MSTDQSTSLWEGLLASPLASQDSGEDWTTRVATWPSGSCSFVLLLDLDGSCGKMSPVSCRSMEDGRLEPSSGRWRNSGTGSPGECWTLSTLEFPNDAVASSLSDALETGGVPRRYYLSSAVCEGILRRAERRGKTLPPLLDAALRSQSKGT
jgi:hypothetical protein